ncbi:ATP-dependent endonuclease [Micromonospora marina]|uniref:ATPase/GTPase, AAA15 family n=1 Tax=Micromonospora marina TaxID=307120 RepID=A0A1C4YKC0_9ACTN|nr:AAA family ATPase [Micromonospora marina]SCF21183.1 ATPase/GTPase, AAA15 family [Micromonospora marina]
MHYTSVSIKNFRSIVDSGEIPLGPVTLLVGRNNSGKSTIIRALYLSQEGAPQEEGDVRVGSSEFEIDLKVGEWSRISRVMGYSPIDPGSTVRLIGKDREQVRARLVEGDKPQPARLAGNVEPNNAIYPVLATRRQSRYEEQVRRDSAITVSPTDSNLVSRVMTLATSEIPEARAFRTACRDVLGVNLNILTGEHGQQRLGVQIDRFTEIPLSAMGAGITSALNLLLSLSSSQNKLFLIEEPESDLHPQALKALLDLVVSAARTNQFVISTHSSIVLAKLGAVPGAVVVHSKSDGKVPPISTYDVVSSPAARLSVMQDLGYELADLDLGEGWLIFEESSAERLAREFLIPWFAPRLLRLRTLAATGTSRLEPIMQDYLELFLFAHLEPMYRGRAWVIADGDESGISVIEKLKLKFSGWPSDRFINFDRPDFELYYPSLFKDDVDRALLETDRRRRREAKRLLLNKVLAWIAEDELAAREAFSQSAGEVIDKLQAIEGALLALGRVSGGVASP